jgi:hypothetical protein
MLKAYIRDWPVGEGDEPSTTPTTPAQ